MDPATFYFFYSRRAATFGFFLDEEEP